MPFTELVNVERYRMRSSSEYRGDRVERRTRLIGGKRFEFARIRWGDGSVTIRAYRGGSGEPFREWTACGMYTDPEYLGR